MGFLSAALGVLPEQDPILSDSLAQSPAENPTYRAFSLTFSAILDDNPSQ